MTQPNRNPQPTLEQLEASLAPTLRDFRRASTLYAEREQSLLPSSAATGRLANWNTGNWEPKTNYLRRWTIAATAACAFILCAVILTLSSAKRNALRISSSSEPHATTTTQASISDEALLENVATDLSTSVPTPLQSLAPQPSTSTTTTVTQ